MHTWAVTAGVPISDSTDRPRFRNLPRMSSVWYYESEGTRQGPVPRMKIVELIGLGAIRDETLVWTEGMTDWRPCSEVAELTTSASYEAATVDEPELETCAYSGKRLPRTAMLPFGDEWVAFEHRQEFIQRLQEGRDETEDPLPGYPFLADLNLVTMLSQGWQIVAAQWWLIVGFAALIWLPFDFLITYLEQRAGDEGVNSPQGLDNWSNLLVGSFMNGGILAYGLSRWNGGGKWRLGSFFGAGRTYFGRIVGLRFLLYLFLIVVVIPFVIVAVLSESVPIISVMALVGGCLITYLGTRLACAESFAIIFDEGAGDALKRSWRQTKERFWRLLLIRLIVYVPMMVSAVGLVLLTELPGMQNLWVGGALAVVVSCLSALVVVFEMVIALHLQANPLPPKEAVSTLPSLEGPHDPAA